MFQILKISWDKSNYFTIYSVPNYESDISQDMIRLSISS